MEQGRVEETLESLPLYAMIFCGKGGASATRNGRNGIVSIPNEAVEEFERLTEDKAESLNDPERGLAIAAHLHLKGGDVIQKGFKSYHYSNVCWSLLQQEADRLRRKYKLP